MHESFHRVIASLSPLFPKVAVKSGIPLKMAARHFGDDYWLKKIKPMIDRHQDMIEFIGEINDTEKK
jgi:hypothetical protein